MSAISVTWTRARGRFVPVDTTTTVGEPLMKLPKDLIQPRIGFAWNFLGDDKTVLRGGFGIFHDQLWMNLYGNTRQLFPFAASISQVSPIFLDPLSGQGNDVRHPSRRDPYSVLGRSSLRDAVQPAIAA